MDFGMQSPRGPNVSISGRGRQNGFRLPSSSFSPGIVPFQEFIIVVPPPSSLGPTRRRDMSESNLDENVRDHMREPRFRICASSSLVFGSMAGDG